MIRAAAVGPAVILTLAGAGLAAAQGGVIKGVCDNYLTIMECLDNISHEWDPWSEPDYSKYATATALADW